MGKGKGRLDLSRVPRVRSYATGAERPDEPVYQYSPSARLLGMPLAAHYSVAWLRNYEGYCISHYLMCIEFRVDLPGRKILTGPNN